VTPYLAMHPGGKHIILAFAGKDATLIFNDIAHSSAAMKILNQLCIGVLQEPVPVSDNICSSNDLNSMNATRDSSESTLKEVEDAFKKFNMLILDNIFPCVGAKTAVRTDGFVFRFYTTLNTTQSVEDSCKDLQHFTDKQQPDMWKQGNKFTTFVCVFKGPYLPRDPQLVIEHVKAMHLLLTNEHMSIAKKTQSNQFLFNGIGFFVPGLHDNNAHILKQFRWPVLVFNTLLQFSHLQDDYELLRKIICRRDQESQELCKKGIPKT